MRPAHRALSAVAVGILAYDVSAPPGETITAGVHHLHQHHRWWVRLAVAVTAAHLLGVMPKGADPFRLVPTRPQVQMAGY